MIKESSSTAAPASFRLRLLRLLVSYLIDGCQPSKRTVTGARQVTPTSTAVAAASSRPATVIISAATSTATATAPGAPIAAFTATATATACSLAGGVRIREGEHVLTEVKIFDLKDMARGNTKAKQPDPGSSHGNERE